VPQAVDHTPTPTVQAEAPEQAAQQPTSPEASPRLSTEQLQGYAKQLADARQDITAAKAELQSLTTADNSDQRDIRRLEGLRDADQTSINRHTNNIANQEARRVWRPSEISERRSFIADARQQIDTKTAAIEEKTARRPRPSRPNRTAVRET